MELDHLHLPCMSLPLVQEAPADRASGYPCQILLPNFKTVLS